MFRPPEHPLILSVLIGVGTQIITMLFLSIIFAWLSFEDENNRATFVTSLLVFFIFMGIFAGYYSARMYKLFKGINWLRCTLLTAMIYPLSIFTVFLIIDISLAMEKSSASVRTSEIFVLKFLGWICGYF